jgi:ABC-type glycerol-3-phosphate transport system permease component
MWRQPKARGAARQSSAARRPRADGDAKGQAVRLRRAAASTLYTIPPILFFLLVQRRMAGAWSRGR